MWRPRSARSLASVQEWLPLEAIEGDLVRLRNGDYRAVLRASGVNFALKSELEQEAIFAGYRRFLNGLAYPLQLLVRIAPTDIETYLSALRARGAGDNAMLRRLFRDHENFVRTLAGERLLLDRRYYIVIPSELEFAGLRPALRFSWRRDRERDDTLAHDREAARRKLAFRCDEVAQHLAPVGVETTRLGGEALLRLWRDVLAGEQRVGSQRESPAVVNGPGDESVASDA